jgi:hypothetical protein
LDTAEFTIEEIINSRRKLPTKRVVIVIEELPIVESNDFNVRKLFCEGLLIVAALLPCMSAAQGSSGGGPNLVINGSFESPGSASGAIDPWHSIRCLSLLVAEPQHVADGSNCVIVCGAIYQDIGVVAGMMYQLKFAYGGDDASQANLEPLTVTWGSQTVATLPVDPVSTQAPAWRYLSYDVLATGSNMRLTFSTLPDQAFPLVDNISLMQVPEPRVFTLLGIASLAGFAQSLRRKRNQNHIALQITCQLIQQLRPIHRFCHGSISANPTKSHLKIFFRFRHLLQHFPLKTFQILNLQSRSH